MNLRSFLSASMLVVVGMMGGRILGMLREMMMAAHFGTGPLGDTAITLLMIPDFVTAVLIGAAVSNTLVPAFNAREPERALALLWQALAISIAVFGVMTLALSLQTPWLLAQFGKEPAEEITGALAITLASIPFAVATAVLTAYLQYRSKFLVPAFATVVFNLVIIAFLLFGADNIYLLALGIFAAAFLRFAPHLVASLRSMTAPRLRFTPWEFDRKLLKIYALAAAGGIAGLMPVYAPYAVIAGFGSSIATFNYAFKLLLLPGMIGQTVIQLVLLPWLVAQRKNSTDRAYFSTILQLTWIVSFCMALALTLAAQPIATLFFHYGKMTAEDISRIGQLFAIGIWALPGMLLTAVWQTIFYSESKPGAPLIANTAQAILIVPCCWIGHDVGGLKGVFAALAVLQIYNALLLAILARRSKLLARFYPDRAYFTMTLAAVLVALPFFHLASTGITNQWLMLAVAIVYGITSLAAGALASPLIRQHCNQWVRR